MALDKVSAWDSAAARQEMAELRGLGFTGNEFAPLNRIRWYFADQFDNPVTSNWIVNALAPAVTDSVNSALTIRAFDDTTEEGVGFIEYVPAEATDVKYHILSRAQTAPGATRTVGVKLYFRRLQDNTSISTTWAGSSDGSDVMTDISIPTNTNFQYDTETLDFVSDYAPDIIAGNYYQFELTRINPTGGTELTGDWNLLAFGIEWL